jgi:hypothetical protein
MARHPRRSGETYTIHLGGNWTLEDLSKFSRAYEQVYLLIKAVEFPTENPENRLDDHVFQSFPWLGGYSAVGFYNNLKYLTPLMWRPKIISIEYASPGWLELGLLAVAAVKVETIVKAIASSVDHINATYNAIRKGMHDRKLSEINVRREQLRLDKETIDFIDHSTYTMTQLLGLGNIKQLDEKTGNRLASLKIILSLYRRLKILVDFQLNGKAKFNNSRDPSDVNDLIS